MTSFRFYPKTLAAVVSLMISPSILAAPYSKIIAFGDSLTDSGQYLDGGSLMLGVPGNARFTNRVGPTYSAPAPFEEVAIQIVSRTLGLGELNASTSNWSGVATGKFSGTNYALAGSTTPQILNSITVQNGSVVAAGVGSAAVNNPQFVDPRTRNGYLFDNPKADRNALFFLNGGANDVFNGLITDPASAATSAANLGAGIDALHSAGALYIMVSNIPELDGTALANFGSTLNTGGAPNPIHPNVLGPLSRLYNAALYEEIRTSGANVIPLNVAGLLLEAHASPAKFGFANVKNCFDNSKGSCIKDPQYGLNGTMPNPNRLLFNDSVHPTGAAQKIIADYTLSILESPADISMLPVFGLQITHTDMKRQQNLLNDTRGIDTFGDWQISMAAEGNDYNNTNGNYNTYFDGNYGAISFAGQKRMDKDWRIGGQLSLGEAQFNSEQSASATDIETIGIGFVTTYDHDRYFANAILQIDQLRYADIYRHTPLGMDSTRGEHGDTHGTNFGLATEIGYDISFDAGNWRYGPKLELSLANSKVDSYDEYSTTVTAMGFDDQSLGSQRADAGIFASYLSTDKTISFTSKIGLVSEFDMEGDDVDANLISLDLPSFHLPGYAIKNKSAVSSQASVSYSPSAASRVALRYQAITGGNATRSLTANMTFHF